MASSKRHWPSLFKSKPCNPHHHQWQHDINPSSSHVNWLPQNPYASDVLHLNHVLQAVPGCEERSPEPKPRWNPKPEQIRDIGSNLQFWMVNPPRDEIRKIRAQLQEYGQVGDANVFYWFQNRKSRSKHKLRNFSKQQQMTPSTTKPVTATLTAPSSLSSSSERSSPKHKRICVRTFFFPVQQTGGETAAFAQGFCFSELSNVVHVQDHTVGPCTSLLLNEITNSSASKKVNHEDKNRKMEPQLSYTATSQVTHSIDLAPLPLSANASTVSIQSTIIITFKKMIVWLSGPGESGVTARSTVFINDVAFEVAMGPFNVREAFGDDILLIHSSGQPVLTNEWGVTLDSLQHGALYYLVPLYTSEHESMLYPLEFVICLVTV
uniref:Homeobox domain-containing protein n=1 Tax=Salix viminalis TaxID=40686 RepID=A0A6N2KFS3_SALVM